MQHYYSLQDVTLTGAWLTIGSFDGVHRGHQELIHNLTDGAHSTGAPAVVLTFFPHPSVVLRNKKEPFYLGTPEERAELLGELGVDVVITEPFTPEVAATSARDFITRLIDRLGISNLWVGHDFALGRGREGTVPVLRQLGQELGYSVHEVPPFHNGGKLISSSSIRAALADGDVESAAQLLGRPYRIAGRVIHGDGRGRTIGIPTANLDIWAERAIPRSGVYACRAKVADQNWSAVTNVGVRPTFESAPVSPRVETHLLDFDRELYGQTIELAFIARLRDEQRFQNVDGLLQQIRRDIERGRAILTDVSTL